MAVGGGQWVNEWLNVPRVAVSVKSRVDKLKALGNAIVPQMAYIIGSMILECERQHAS